MGFAEKISDPLTFKQSATNDDKDFCLFYYKVLKRLLNFNNKANASYLHRYFKILDEYCDIWCRVKQNFDDSDDTIISLLTDSLYYRLAFVYRNATLLSSAVAFHLRNVYEKSPTIINRLMIKKLVKICSFGGGAAADIVAIVRVLESIALSNGIELDFRVTIIETDERWKITCITILNCLQHFRKATWKITFVEDNLAVKDSWTPETCTAIQEADIITMIRFLSKFDSKKNLKEICDKVQLGAMLFVLDHPVKEIIELSCDVTVSDDFELIHKELWDLHTLDIEAVNRFEILYWRHFRSQQQFHANISFDAFIGVWIKASAALTCQNNITRMFQYNVEKCKLQHSFLNCNFFKMLKKLFKKEKEASGLSPKDIRKLRKEKERKNRPLSELINERKKLDILRKDLLNKLQSSKKEEKDSNKIDKESLKSYLIQKRNYSFMKRTIYYNFYFSNRYRVME